MTAPDVNDSAAQVSPFKAWWWRDNHFGGNLSSFWPPELDQCPAWTENSAYQVVSREDVFGVASHDGPHRHVRTAVAAYVWGVGKSAYQIGWLVRAFTRHDPAVVEKSLARAAGLLDSDGAVAAFGSMRPGGPNYIKFMGAAFFTKYLFFTGYRSQAVGPLPLIIDKRVATGLRALADPPGLAFPRLGAELAHQRVDAEPVRLLPRLRDSAAGRPRDRRGEAVPRGRPQGDDGPTPVRLVSPVVRLPPAGGACQRSASAPAI